MVSEVHSNHVWILSFDPFCFVNTNVSILATDHRPHMIISQVKNSYRISYGQVNSNSIIAIDLGKVKSTPDYTGLLKIVQCKELTPITRDRQILGSK